MLECVPDWACDAKKIEIIDVSYNLLTEVPVRYVGVKAYITRVFTCVYVCISLIRVLFLLFSAYRVPVECKAVCCAFRNVVIVDAWSWLKRFKSEDSMMLE